MMTKIVQLCNERNVIFSTRVSIDGVNDMHGKVRNVKNAFEKAGKLRWLVRGGRSERLGTGS